MSDDRPSRAGAKLDHALETFGIDPAGWTCADLGCSSGGFTDSLLRHGVARVFAVDRGYGVLDYRLRTDSRVVVMERTDALQVHLPEPVRLVTIDCGWTRQALILPSAIRLLEGGGQVISLIKPQYEATPQQLCSGILPGETCPPVLATVRESIKHLHLRLLAETESPIRGSAGNREFLWHFVKG
jgi:23S rRNA (cytidine1920-2'-O)/16S rRNA (cytidine1409-2'-O)-methyltransferase